MTDEVTYAYYPVYRRSPGASFIPGQDAEDGAREWEVVLEEAEDRVQVRGIYSTVGFRPDADLMLWLVSHSADDLQAVAVQLGRTGLGRRLALSHAFLGAVRPAEFNPDHVPSFLRGEAPRRYLCVYPFVRTTEWYLLPPEDRAALLKEHGELGREFPDVLPNTTSGFGLGDWEWILAFEADELHRIVDCIRRLRDSETRRYTKAEVPFITGIRKDLAAAVRDLA